MSQSVPEKHTALLGAGLVPLPRGAGITVQVNPGSLIAGCCFSFVLVLAPSRGSLLLLLSLFYLLWAQERRGLPACALTAAQRPLRAEWWASGGRAADAAVSVMPKSLPTSASWIPSRVGWDYPALSQCFQIAEKYQEHGKGVAARRLRGGALACPPVTVWQGQGTWEASGLGAGVFPAHSQAASPAGYVQLPEPDQLGRRGWAVTSLVSCFPASGQLRSCKNP